MTHMKPRRTRWFDKPFPQRWEVVLWIVVIVIPSIIGIALQLAVWL